MKPSRLSGTLARRTSLPAAALRRPRLNSVGTGTFHLLDAADGEVVATFTKLVDMTGWLSDRDYRHVPGLGSNKWTLPS